MAPGGEKKVILLVGGSGYLGLHVIEALASSPCDYTLAYTYNSHPAPADLAEKFPNVLAFRLDLRSGEGLEEISKLLDTVRRSCEQYLKITPTCLALMVASSNASRMLSEDGTPGACRLNVWGRNVEGAA